jgi:hypothetical protein
MLENVSAAPAAGTSPHRSNIEYFTIRLGHLADGLVGVSIEATTFDEEELALLSQELGASQVPSIDDALAFVRASVSFN